MENRLGGVYAGSVVASFVSGMTLLTAAAIADGEGKPDFSAGVFEWDYGEWGAILAAYGIVNLLVAVAVLAFYCKRTSN